LIVWGLNQKTQKNLMDKQKFTETSSRQLR